jgi:hypothetical protein
VSQSIKSPRTRNREMRRVYTAYDPEVRKYLLSFQNGIHQPLHVSFLDDKGGNTIRTSGQCPGNLHAVWDTCLVQYAIGPDASEAADLLAAITPEMKAQWTASAPRDWANESFAITESARTMYCVMHGSSCDLTSGALNITAQYLDANEPILKQQLQMAGVRLARLLDTAFPN